MAFVKLHCSILDSSLWENRDVRDAFLTALLMAEPLELKEPTPTLQIRSLEPDGFVVPPGMYGFIPASSTGIIRRALVDDQEKGIAAIECLARPDLESRSKEYEGRRMVRVNGGFVILNYWRYRERDNTAAQRVKRWRENKKSTVTSGNDWGVQTPVTSAVTPVTALPSASASSSSGSVSGAFPDPAGARSTDDAKAAAAPWPPPPEPPARVWTAAGWKDRFGAAWSAAYQTMARPGGGAAAARATADLGDILAEMAEPQRLEAQGRAQMIFAEYLADADPQLSKARHPWAWFVVRFNGLLVPAKAASRDVTVGHADQRTIERPHGDVGI